MCEAEEVPPENTVGLISVFRKPYGRCTNTHKIDGFAECIGKCDSRTVYNSSKLYHYFINSLLLLIILFLLLLSPLLFRYISQSKCDGSELQLYAIIRERERETMKVYCNKNVFKTPQINS
jgi:hypothetical protein